MPVQRQLFRITPDKHVDVCVDSDEDRGSTPLASSSRVRGAKIGQTGNETGNKSGDVQESPRRFAEDLTQSSISEHALVQRIYFGASEAASF